MKIGIISKYPPIEGGVSSEVYWTAKALGERDVEVILLTDSWSVENNYKEKIDTEEFDLLQPKNVKMYQTNPIAATARKQAGKGGGAETYLLSLGLEIEKKENPDLWYSHYLFPYGIVGYFLSKKVDKPIILRHAGSDLEMLGNPEYISFIDVIRDSDIVISRSDDIKSITDRVLEPDVVQLHSLPPEFDTNGRKYRDKPTIGLIGKENRTKRWKELIDALTEIEDSYSLFLLYDDEGKKTVQKYLSKELNAKTTFGSFTAPWKMPDVYRDIDILYSGEKGFYISTHRPMVPVEGFATGCCNIMSDELYDKYEDVFDLEDGKNVVVTNTLNSEEIHNKISKLIEDKKLRRRIAIEGSKAFKEKNDFDSYIKFLMDTFEETIKCHK